MKRLLWLSNFRFQDSQSQSSGTWIETMGLAIAKRADYQLTNVTCSRVKKPQFSRIGMIDQYEMPACETCHELTSREVIDSIRGIEHSVRPDLIHVWGTERYWGLLTARRVLKAPALLEMQGVPSAMVPYMTGCLSQNELRQCIGFKEIIRPRRSLAGVQRLYSKWWEYEKEIVRGHRFIDYQSEWIKAYIDPFVDGANLFKTRMIVRRPFLSAEHWKPNSGNCTIFSSCGISANKGTHVLLRAVALLTRRFPGICLEIAGDAPYGWRAGGYVKWVHKEIGRLGLEARVRFLGRLDARGLVRAMKRSSLVVVPSLVESYSMSLAEAMAVGCPCVVSYAGAMPEVGGDCVSYFPLADSGACAHMIAQIVENRDFSLHLGSRAAARSRLMHNEADGIAAQMSIYNQIFDELEEGR